MAENKTKTIDQNIDDLAAKAATKIQAAKQQAEREATLAAHPNLRAAVQAALTAERDRSMEIISLCQQAHRPELADPYIIGGQSPAVVKVLLGVECTATFEEEYEADKKQLQRHGITKEAYIASRRQSEGIPDDAKDGDREDYL